MTVECKIRDRCFSEDVMGTTVHFQIVDIGRQFAVWVGCDNTKMSNLYLSGQPRPSEQFPPVATLMPGGASCAAEGLSQRLAAKCGKSVLCSCDLPPNSVIFRQFVEKRLIENLREMSAVAEASGEESVPSTQ